MKNGERYTGVVKVFYTMKGFGFISRKEGKDVFFHFVDIITKGADAAILEGDQVAFSLEIKDGKRRALMVEKLGSIP